MEPDGLHQAQRVGEILVGLPGKPHDHVRRQLDASYARLHGAHQLQVFVPGMAPPHRREDRGRARLDRQVEMLAHVRQFPHRVDEPDCHVPGMRAGEPHSPDARHRIHRREQVREVAAWVVGSLVVVDDLPEQMDFGPTALDRLLDLFQNLALRTHPLMTAGVRDDAESAVVVAALDDGHIRLHRVHPARHPQRERHVVVGVDVDLSGARPKGLVDKQREASARPLCRRPRPLPWPGGTSPRRPAAPGTRPRRSAEPARQAPPRFEFHRCG